MFDKRGISPENIVGCVFFIIGFLAILLLVSIYNVSIATAKYEQIKNFEYDIEACKALNYFLEMRDDKGKRVSDLIVSGEAEDAVESLAKEYFSSNYFVQNSREWKLEMSGGSTKWIVKEKGSITSIGRPNYVYCYASIPIIDEDTNLEKLLKLTLIITKKR